MISRVLLPIVFAGLTVGLIAIGAVHKSSTAPASTPEGAVQAMFADVKTKDWRAAATYVAGSSNTDLGGFMRDLQGRNSSLRTYSQLEKVATRVLHESDNEALVRTELKYSTAVGAFYDTRDLKVVKDDNAWKVFWVGEKDVAVPATIGARKTRRTRASACCR